MRKAIVLPAVAVVGGAAGFALRAWELKTAFEPDTGLPIPGMPSTWLLILLSAAMAAMLVFLCMGKHNSFKGGYDQAFSAKGNTLYITAIVLSGFLLLASAALNILYALRREVPLTRLILAALCAISFFCVLFVGKSNYNGEKRGRFCIPLLLPGYACCAWLVTAYQVRAGDPIQLDYIYELLAIITVLLGLYFSAGFSFERSKFFWTTFFSLLGVYFSIVTLADQHDLATMLLYGFANLYLLSNTITLLYNAARPEPPIRRPPPEETFEDEDNDTEGTIHES